ncbi:MAG: hypothetical protein ACHQC9_03415 [Alphaproteobacteria bacterium]
MRVDGVVACRSGSPDHLAGAGDEGFGHVQAQLRGGLQIDPQLEPGRLFGRQIGGFGAAQDLDQQRRDVLSIDRDVTRTIA